MGSLPNLHALSSADSELSLAQQAAYLPPCRLAPHRLSAGHAPHRAPPLHLRHPHAAAHLVRHHHGTSAAQQPQPQSQQQQQHLLQQHHQQLDTTRESYPPVSPVSIRSCRSVQSSLRAQSRCGGRRDSLASSGDASVRRLIALVRATPSQFGPAFSERALARNQAALCLGHATFAAALVPLLALQTSAFRGEATGAGLLALSFGTAALTSLAAPALAHRAAPHLALVASYVGATLFFALHLYPAAATLLPAYLLFGLVLGPLCHLQVTVLVTLSTKLAFVSEESRLQVQARLARQFHAAQSAGQALGCAVAGLVLWYTATAGDLGLNFPHDLEGRRLCGSSACPGLQEEQPQHLTGNETSRDAFELALPCRSATMLYSIYLGCAVMAVALSATFLDRIPVVVRETGCYLERAGGSSGTRGALCALAAAMLRAFKDLKLICLTPLFLFIGLEQAFILADYSKWYVVCSLGVSHVALALVGMGLLQAVAGTTLSLLLQHVPRALVSVVGLVFHACLALALLTWRPSRDDAALFYVICAAWGVCNAIWETLAFALLSALYMESWAAPLAHSLFWRHMGSLLGFAAHPLLCVRAKLFALCGALLLAVLGLALLERRISLRGRRSHHSLRRAGRCMEMCEPGCFYQQCGVLISIC